MWPGMVAFQMLALHGPFRKAQADNRQRLLGNDEMNYVPDSYLTLLQMPESRHRPSQTGVQRLIGNEIASSDLQDFVIATTVSANSSRTTKSIINGTTLGSHSRKLCLAALVLNFNSARKEIVSVVFSEVTASTSTAAVVMLCAFIIVAALIWWFSMGEGPTHYRRQYQRFPHQLRFRGEAQVVREDSSLGNAVATTPLARENTCMSHHSASPIHCLTPSTADHVPVATVALNGSLGTSSPVLCPALVVGHAETWFSISIEEMMTSTGSFNILGLSRNSVLCGQWARTSSTSQLSLTLSSSFPALATATQIVDTSQQNDRQLFEVRDSGNRLFGIMTRRNKGQFVLQRDEKHILSVEVDPRTGELNVIGEAGCVAVVSRKMVEGREALDVRVGACVDCILILSCVLGITCFTSLQSDVYHVS